MLHYTPYIRKSPQSFADVLQKAKQWFEGLPKTEQDSLKEDLQHGAGHLTAKRQLNAYLSAYGEIHQAKLNQAFEHVPSKIWGENGVSIVDYGCGQGIAEMVLSDFLTSKWADNGFVKDITLIEPSVTNLKQACEYTEAFFPNAKLAPIRKNDSQLNEDDLLPTKPTVLHILSNVIDLEGFDGTTIADILSRDNSHNNIVICVSPYYQEATRGQRMYEFGELLNGFTRSYKFEKHTDEWDKPYSCQIHIYVSSYF